MSDTVTTTEVAPAESTATPATPGPGPVPYARFKELAQQHQGVVSEVERLRAELVQRTETAKQAEALQAQLAELQAQHSSASRGWAEERALITAGVHDPEGQDVARMFYSRLPAEDRPEISEWLTSLKAEGASVPRALAPYIGAPAPAVTQAPVANAPRQMPRPSGPAGVAPPSASPVYSAEQIRAMTAEAKRTGDYAALRAAMPAINASLRVSGTR